MPFNVKHDPVPDIIEVIYTGSITGGDMRKAATQAISIQKQTGTTRFILDASGWDGHASLMDIYDSADKQYWKEELNPLSLIAVIIPTSVRAEEAGRFYETVCFNRGWNAKICPDHQSAMDWLLGKSATPD